MDWNWILSVRRPYCLLLRTQRRKDAAFIDRKGIAKIEFGTTNKKEKVVDECYDQSEMCTSNRAACG